MNTWGRIDQADSYPRIAGAVSRRTLGDETSLAQVLRLGADFDRGSVLRYLICAIISPSAFIQIHVGKLEDGGASVAISVHPLSRLGSVVTLELPADPETEDAIRELTPAAGMQDTRRLGIKPARYEDPNCLANHDYSATSLPDDLATRISAAADGAEALEEAECFVEVLPPMLRRSK